MLRLAEGGSTERFAIGDPDITCLGKWVGGGLPVGAITASKELMSPFDLEQQGSLNSISPEPEVIVADASLIQ